VFEVLVLRRRWDAEVWDPDDIQVRTLTIDVEPVVQDELSDGALSEHEGTDRLLRDSDDEFESGVFSDGD
jgi:hypothetical protein